MIVYFADRDLAILGMASTSLPEGFVLTNDNKIEDIDTGVASFEFEINFRDDDILKAKELAKEGNYVLRQSGDIYEAYTIIEVEINSLSQTIYCYAEDGGLDLLNGVALPETATEAHPAAWYITEWLNYQDSGFEIGINEIPSLSRKLIWEGESTITERIRSVATQFDNAEISYSFKIDGFRITKKYVNIFKKRGKDVAQELRLGREVGNIVERRSIANLATGYYAKGGIPEPTDSNPNPQPITLRGFSYDDGDFYTNDIYILNRTAHKYWSRLKSGYIIKTFEYDTTSQQELFNRALSALKKAGEPEINYEVELLYLPENLSLGDTVRVVDDNGELYLSARLLRLEVSEANNTRMATFGEFLIKTSGISEQVRQLSEEFSKLTPSHTMYTWIAWADDAVGSGISLSSTDKPYIGIATNKFASTPDITDASIYTWTRIEGIDGQDGRDGEDGAPGTDGVNGTSIRNKGAWAASTAYVSNATYLDVVTYNGSSYICKSSHTSGSTFDNSKWDLLAQKGDQGIQGTQGPQGIQGPAGTDGVSSYIHIKYSAVANPTDSQMSEIPNTYIGICVNETVTDPTTASSYTWSKFEGTDGTNGQPGAPGTNGQTSYVHFAYATSSDGSEDFSTTSFDGAKYIGVYTDFIQADSTDYTKYTWSLIKGADGEDGQDGQDGYSPTATVSKSGDTATITITDKNGTTTQTVTDGTDGVSVTNVTSTNNTQDGGTSVVTVTLSDGTTKTFNVKNGNKGSTGDTAEWFYGTALTHTSGTATASVTGAVVGSMYLNTDTSLVYKCTAISGSTMTWTYAGDLTTGVIENIDVGGRNLARNTGVMTSSDWVLQRSTVTDSVLTMTPTTSSANAKYKIDYLPYGIYKNNYFTISFDCREVETGSYGTGPVRVCFMVQIASRVNNLVGSSSDRYQTFNLDSQGTDWHRYSITKKIPDEITLGQESALVDSSYVSFQFVRNASTRPIEIKNIKFERGNIATDWSPAPEDLEIGGRNYLQTVSRIGASGTTSGVTWTLGKGCVTLNGTSTSYGVIISQKCFGGLTLEPGVYSVWTDSDKCCFRIGKGSSATHVYSSEGTFLKSSPYILDVSESDIYYVAPIVKNGVTFSNEVVHFMLEKGNKPSDWTPAPEDVEADIDDAKKVATNYMSSDTTGIMVADLNDGEQTPATATGRNVRITNTAVEVRDGQDVKASFGETVVIGEEGSTRVEISSDDTTFYGVDGTLAGQIANGDSQQRALLSNDLYYTNYVSSDISGMSFTTIVDSLKLGTESTIQYVVYIGLEGSPEENYEPSVSRTSSSTTQINSTGCPFSIAYTPGAQTSTFVVSFGNIPDYQEIEYIDVEVLGFKLVTTAHYQFGLNNTSSGEQSFAEGSSTTASGNFSHSEGYGTKAIGSYAHAEGCTGSSASGIASHAEGGFTAATASYTHAEGFGTSASVIYSHAEGYYSKAKCDASHAEGNHTEASGYYSHSQNHHTVAYNFAETALGQYNANTKLGVNNPGTYAIYIGNGTDTKRNNALLVDWKGDVYLALDEYEDDGTKDSDLAWGMDALGWMTNDTTPSIFNDAPMLDLKQLLIRLVEHYPRYLSAKPTFTVNSTNVTTLTQSVAVADGMVVGSFRAVNKIQFAAGTSYIIGTVSPKPSFNAVFFVRCGNVFNIQGWVGASDGGVYVQSASAIAANKTFEGMFIYKPA